MRILIYGAGVIGSLYAVLLKEVGYDTTIYARGHRLEDLQNQGLLYNKNNIIKKVDIKVIDYLQDNDIYDFIFLTVRENQLYQALKELKSNKSKNIITMVNSIDTYEKWESIVGKGRILPAFPGAGGSITNDILDASLTPRFIQPTTFSEITGKKTNRTQQLIQIFKHARIPFQQVNDMHIWQLCHLGMVVPLADAYYQTEYPESVGQDKLVMKNTAKELKHNFKILYEKLHTLSPYKMHIFRILPIPILTYILSQTYKSCFGYTFMYQHAIKAPDEMKELHNQFNSYIKKWRL